MYHIILYHVCQYFTYMCWKVWHVRFLPLTHCRRLPEAEDKNGRRPSPNSAEMKLMSFHSMSLIKSKRSSPSTSRTGVTDGPITVRDWVNGWWEVRNNFICKEIQSILENKWKQLNCLTMFISSQNHPITMLETTWATMMRASSRTAEVLVRSSFQVSLE